MASVLIIYSCLLLGAKLGVHSSPSYAGTTFPGPYLVSDPGQFHEPDPATGHPVSFRIVPLYGDSRGARERRDVVPEEGNDKSALAKSPAPTKKPTALGPKEVVNMTVSVSSTTSSSKGKPEVMSPSVTTPSPSNFSSKLTTMKSLVVDVVPTRISPTMKSLPGPKVSNVTQEVSTTGSPDLYPPLPEFPPDLSHTYNVTKNDTHKYYVSNYFLKGEYLWVDLDVHPEAVKHELLSDAHRRAATVKLEFEFPFYGHIVQNVTVATGGFIYLGEQVHAWLAATQYVAPLMANFDSRFDNASVRYLSNATQFTVEWDQVHLHDSITSGAFTFQTSLYKNGTIVFAYKGVPVDVRLVNDTNHPVKVGLSDAYITDKTLLFVKQKTIYEYDRVDLKTYSIVNGSGIVFTALPTCLSYKTCAECTGHETNFSCQWCQKAGRCSDGTDRHRQDWLVKLCNQDSVSTPISCFIGTRTSTTEDPTVYHNIGHDDLDSKHLISPGDHSYQEPHQTALNPQKVKHEEADGMSASGVVALLFFFMVIFGGGGWILYAYYYPHTPSGQLLIRFRPSQWGAFRRGEARYTAASIHM